MKKHKDVLAGRISNILVIAAMAHLLLYYLVFGIFNLLASISYLAVAYFVGQGAVLFLKKFSTHSFIFLGIAVNLLYHGVFYALSNLPFLMAHLHVFSMLSTQFLIISAIQQGLLAFVMAEVVGGKK